MAGTLLNGMVCTEAMGRARRLRSQPVGLPTRKACACCPLVDVEMGLAWDRELTRSREGRGTDPQGSRDREIWTERQVNTDRDRDEQRTEK